MTTPPPPRIQPATARVKMTLGGSIGGAPWQAAFWFTSDGTGTHSPTDLATDVAAALAIGPASLQNSWAAMNHSSTQWQTLRFDYYPSGSAAVLVTGLKAAIAKSGSIGFASAASQCAVVTSLSATAGRSGKGRTFLPATGSLTGGGQPYEFATVQATNLVQDFGTWLSNLNAAPAFIGVGKLRASVLSLTLGQMFPITSLRVDTRPDRQEHREKRLVFGQQVKAVTP